MSLVSVFLQFADPTVETKVELVYRSLNFYRFILWLSSLDRRLNMRKWCSSIGNRRRWSHFDMGFAIISDVFIFFRRNKT